MVGETVTLSNALEHFPAGRGRKALIDLVAPLDFAGRISGEDARRIAAAAGLDGDALLVALVPLATAYARPVISEFCVGAVVRGLSGALYCGANLEFAGTSLWHSLHAEQAAVAQAWAAAESGIDALAVGTVPCGLCRQFLLELGDPANLAVLVAGTPRATLAEMLPHGFGPAALGRPGGLLGCAPPMLALEGRDQDPLTLAALDAAQRSYAPYTGAAAGIALKLRSGAVVDGSYAESVAHNPSLAPLAMALSRRVFAGLEADEIAAATLVAVGHAQIDHTAQARTLLAAVAPGVRLHLRAAQRA
ncbi:MAG: cytidine deaminase [Rhodospirillales bacterium]|jgi:cytidine deaminase